MNILATSKVLKEKDCQAHRNIKMYTFCWYHVEKNEVGWKVSVHGQNWNLSDFYVVLKPLLNKVEITQVQ